METNRSFYSHTTYKLISSMCATTVIYTVRLLSFRTDCAQRILRVPSGGQPQKRVEASLDTLCA